MRTRPSILLLACLLTACSAPSTGTSRPSATSSVAPTGSPATTVHEPSRPRDLDLSRLDVCTLLTTAQRRVLQLDQPPIRNNFTSTFYGNQPVRGCSMDSEAAAYDVGLLASDHIGIEAWTTQTVNGTVLPIKVAGFPAIRATQAGQTRFCTVAVDVGPHHVLDIQYSDGFRKPARSQQQLCDGAEQIAEQVMQTTLATIGG